MLKGVDTLVVDLQDIGARFYTYMTTMAYVMEEAAKRNIGVVVLDRVNPINGVQIEGPALDKAQVGFTGYFPAMPIRHGMTMGELAELFNAENKIGADLTVVKLRNWRRDQWFDMTGQPWINPSPNMRNLIQATLYPGIGAIEGTNISVGRGTDTPFEQVGAPWIDGVQLADALNARNLPGIRFYPVRFTPIVEQVRERGVPGRVHGRDRSSRAAAGPRGRRDRGRALPPVRFALRHRGRRQALRLRSQPRRAEGGRRPRHAGVRMVPGGSALAPAPRATSALQLTSVVRPTPARIRPRICAIRNFGVSSSSLLDAGGAIGP